MPRVEVRGTSFFYEDDDFTDPWEDTATVLIQHGVGRSGEFWRPWVPALARQHRVIRRDQRGHGRTPDPGPDYEWTFDGLVEDVVGFLDALELDSVHYVGESLGGVIGMALAARSPERIRSLVLCAAPVTLQPPRNEVFKAGYPDSATAKRTLGAAGWADAMIERGVISGGSSPAQRRWVVEEMGNTSAEVLVGIGTTLYPPNDAVEPLLTRIAVPTLVLAPTNSPVTPLAEQRRIAARIPAAKLVAIDGPTHEIGVDRPDDCLGAVLPFLRSVDRR